MTKATLSQVRDWLRKVPVLYAIAMFALTRKYWIGATFGKRVGLAVKAYRRCRDGMPDVVAIQPDCVCPLRCEFCQIHELKLWEHRRRRVMPLADFASIIDDIAPYTTDIQFSGGEPFIHPDITRMFAHCRARGIYTLAATNAVLLNDERIAQIIANPPDAMLMSYEALDARLYEEIRKKGNYDVLVRNIRALIEAKRKSGSHLPLITLQMVLNKRNRHQVADYWQQVADMGADIASVKALGVWPEGNAVHRQKMLEDYVIPMSEDPISRHDIIDGRLTYQRREGQCPSTRTVSIGSGGEVMACWYLVVAGGGLGYVPDEPFARIWNSAKYRRLRERMLDGWAFEECSRCIGVGATGQSKRVKREEWVVEAADKKPDAGAGDGK